MSTQSSLYEHSIPIPQRLLSDYGKKIRELGNGDYGIHEYKTDTRSFAIKKLNSEDRFISPSMEREIAIMRRLKHPRILPLIDVVANDEKKNLYMVLPLAQHDLKRAVNLSEATKKKYAYQILLAVAYCHSRDILHLDIKPQNFLVFEDGLKLADFGLALSSNRVTNYDIIEEVQTRWYRSPELLLGGDYRRSDDWAVGCALYELYTGCVLFPGDCVIDQLYRIFRVFGTPTPQSWPGVQGLRGWDSTFPNWKNTWSQFTQKLPPEMEGIIVSLLQMDPSKRSTVFNVLQNAYFDGCFGDHGGPKTFDDIREDESSIVPTSDLEILDMRDAYLIYGKMAIVNPERLRVLNHMKVVCADYDVPMRAYFLAVHIFDDTNLILQLPDERLSLLTSACLWIASLFVERCAIDVAQLVTSSNDLFTINELIDMQLHVLKTVSYDLCRTTCYDFLIELQREYNDKIVSTASDILCLLTLTDLPFRYTASELAIGALYIGCMCHNDKFLHAQGYTSRVEEVVEYAGEIHDTMLERIFAENESGLTFNVIQKRIQESLVTP